MDVPQFIAGRFRIECEIGRGGMGTVYRATHLGLQRSVAVKIIKSEYAQDADVADRFMREARTMAKLRHAHAAMIFDAGTLPDGRHFIIMEFIEGITLSDALADEGRFSPERAVKIATQICDALGEAHQLGIIHRDLKPANIMLNERGAYVLDFGVAKVLATSSEMTASHASTGSGQVLGTPRYMSPEQCLGHKLGPRSDLYSLGVVLYEMLAGRPPFIDPLPSVVLVKQATAAPPPLPKLRPDIPRSLSLAVHTLLAKRPEDRPQTAAKARMLLERSLFLPERVHAPIEADPLSAMVAAASHPRSTLVRIAAPLLLVSIMGALLLALGYGGPAAEMAAPDQPALTDLANRAAAVTVANTNTKGKTDSAAPAPVTVSQPRPVSMSTEQAKNIVSANSDDLVSGVVVTQTPRGLAILAVQDRGRGPAGFLMVEQRGQNFRITDRGALDTAKFQARKWTAEKLSANNDGRSKILFTGISAARRPALRLVLYDPRKRAAYSLTVETDPRTGQTRRTQWSDNIGDSRAAAYRVLLRDKARALIARGLLRIT